jgi:hypothetical protein
MRSFLAAGLVGIAMLAQSFGALAVTPAEEKQFVENYKKAYEAKDAKAMTAMLYSKGADPQALEFFTMMMTTELDGKIASIELRDLNADDKARLANSRSPDGRPFKFVAPPIKTLVVKFANTDTSESSYSETDLFVAEVDGQLRIPVPASPK